MKRIAAVALALACALALGLVGCAKGGTGSAASGADQTGTTYGDWTVNTLVTPQVADDDAKLFADTLADIDPDSYEPIAVLAHRDVDDEGAHFAYLCKATPPSEGALTDWVVLDLIVDESGASDVFSVATIDVSDIWVSTDEQPAGPEAWAALIPQGTELLPTEAAESWDEAIQSYVGLDLAPIAVLAVNQDGITYQVLCAGAPVVPDPPTNLYVVTLGSDSTGASVFTDVELFNINGYTS